MRAAPPIERHAVGRARRGSRRRLPGRPRGTVDPDPSTRRDASLRSLHRAPSPRRSTARSHGTRSAPAHARASARCAAGPRVVRTCSARRSASVRGSGRPRSRSCVATTARATGTPPVGTAARRPSLSVSACPIPSATPIPGRAGAARLTRPTRPPGTLARSTPLRRQAAGARRFEIDPATWHVMLRRTGVGSADVSRSGRRRSHAGRGDRRRKRRRAPPRRVALVVRCNPAASYSPRGSLPKYHRR